MQTTRSHRFLFTVAVRRLLAPLSLACLSGIALAQVQQYQKLSADEGGVPFGLDDHDQFGHAIASLTDLDGDTIQDLVVCTPKDDAQGTDRGGLWVLFLELDGTVRARQRVNATQGGLTGPLDNGDNFGASVAALGDLDGDGVEDVIVGASRDDDGANNAGALYVLFLQQDGKVKAQTKISASAGGFNRALSAADVFGSSVANVGDLDGDGLPEVAVGAPQRDDGGVDRGAVWILFLAADGTVRDSTELSGGAGNVPGLQDSDRFGSALTTIGDLDGDGVCDLAVGADGDDDGGQDRGAVWILFLKADGSVDGVSKISSTEGNFSGELSDLDRFGRSLACLEDFDGDGLVDLAVGAVRDDDGGNNRGGVWILALLSDGTVQFQRKISDLEGGFGGQLENGDNFGSAIAHLGDVDRDGRSDFVVGAALDNDGGTDTGASWVLLTGDYATVQLRTGSNVNPACFTAVNIPILGKDWISSIDTSANPATTTSFLIGFSGVLDPGIQINAGELLVDPTSAFFFSSSVASSGGVDQHVVPIANDLVLLGFPLYAQAGLLGGGLVLCNGIDLVSGY